MAKWWRKLWLSAWCFSVFTCGLFAKNPTFSFRAHLAGAEQNGVFRYVTETYIEIRGENIDFNPQNGECLAFLDFTLDFFLPHAGPSVYQAAWRDTLRLDESIPLQAETFRRARRFTPPPGAYRVVLEVSTPQGLWVEECVCAIPPLREHTFSDIRILNVSGGVNVSETVSNRQTALPFDVLFYDTRRKPLAMRALLYKKEPIKALEFAQKYLLVQQLTTAFYAERGFRKYEGRFSIEGLEAGEYMIAVYALDDEKIIAEATRPFFMEWRGTDALYANIDSSVAEMRYGAPPAAWEKIDDVHNPEQKRALFTAFWQSQNPPDEIYPARAMEEYFQKTERVGRLYREGALSGTRTERGQVYLLLGPPDVERTETNKLEWRYRKLNLVCRFEKQGERFILQNQSVRKLLANE